MNDALSSRLDRLIDEGEFSGVVSVVRGQDVVYSRAAGFADRAHGIANTIHTQFALASGTKGLTALAVLSLVAEGRLALDTEVRALPGAAGEMVGGGVTLRHLLAHTSGIGDYLDEGTLTDIEDHVLNVPVHRLATPQDYLPVLRGRPAKLPPGQRFVYCNSGYVLLALLIEAVSGRSYHDVVHERVIVPAGMQATAFLRLDELPGSAAIGYLRGPGCRTNTLHLPVRGAGDGGVYSTAEDLARLWAALFAGRIVPLATLTEMLRPQHDATPHARRYGLGFWLVEERGAAVLEGCDAGISFRSHFEPATGTLFSVLSNTTSGAWPLARELVLLLPG